MQLGLLLQSVQFWLREPTRGSVNEASGGTRRGEGTTLASAAPRERHRSHRNELRIMPAQDKQRHGKMRIQ